MSESLQMFFFLISIGFIVKFSILLIKFLIEHFPDFDDDEPIETEENNDEKGDEENDD